MATLQRAVKELQSERNRLEKELDRVNAALSALSSLNSRGRGRRRAAGRRATVRPQRRMSASARRRIAAAQKARWAKLRQERMKLRQERLRKAA